MNVKQKLGYMCIGCLFTIAGYILVSLGGGATQAQKDEQVLDKIVCRKLKVVNKEGKEVAFISGTEDGFGMIVVNNAAGKEGARIVATEKGGGIGFSNAAENPVVTIGTFVADGSGFIVVHNASEKAVVGIGVNKAGDGFIKTYKGGWRIH